MTRNLAVLSGVSLLQDAASELLYPVLPVFLSSVLRAPVVVVGFVEGLGAALASVTSPLAGRLAGRVGRRRLIGAGYSMAALGKALVAAATVWPVVLVGRSVDRLGKGVRGAPRDAVIAEGVHPTERGRAFGFHRMADTTGAVIGPLAGAAGYELLHHHLRPLLVIAVVPAVASALLVLAVRDRRQPAHPARPAAGVAPPGPVPDPAGDATPLAPVEGAADPSSDPAAGPPPAQPADAGAGPLPRSFWGVTALLTLFALVNFPDALLIVRLRAIGFSVLGVLFAYVTYNLVYSLASYPAGALSDRVARPRVFGAGVAFFAVGYLGLGLARSHVVAWLVLAAYGLFTACTDGVGKAWISALVGPDHQARAQGWFQGATGGGVLVAGVWAGLAWHGTGRLPLLVSGTVAAAFAAWLVVLAPFSSRRAGR